MAHLHRRAESAPIDSLSSWYTLVYDPLYHLLHPHKPLPNREALVLWIGLRPFRQVADTWPLRPADNQPNPCGTQEARAVIQAGIKNRRPPDYLHRRPDKKAYAFFNVPPDRPRCPFARCWR